MVQEIIYESNSMVDERITEKYISKIKEMREKQEATPEVKNVVAGILNEMEIEYSSHNRMCERGAFWRIQKSLTNRQIAELMMAMYEIRLIAFSEEANKEHSVLGIYNEEYKSWFKDVQNSNSTISKDIFLEQLKDIVSDEWEFKEKGNPSKVHFHKLDTPEYLIEEYDLVKWKNSYYRGEDRRIKCRTDIKTQYREVFVRKTLFVVSNIEDSE